LVQKKIPNAYILLDNHHLIIRYMNNSNRSDKARHALFINNKFKIIIVELGAMGHLTN
jgi:hypothetical protein